jgi:hypothetical protein
MAMLWHERKHVGLALRFAGLGLLAIGGLIGRRLFAVADPQGKFCAFAYLLALIGIMSASAGSALALLGQHLFEQVELPSRWIIHDPAERQS